MTPQHARLALGAFVLLSIGVATNILALQPTGGGPRPPTADGAPVAEAAKPAPKPAAAKPAAKPAIASDQDNPDVVSAIQRELAARDYDLGTPDGVATSATRAAIMAWEHDNKLPLTGEPTSAALKAIILGVDHTTAVQIASELRAAPKERAPRTEHLIRSVQQSLVGLGYNLGRATGHLNEDTIRAIREFEQDQALPATGRISSTLVNRLGEATQRTGSSASRTAPASGTKKP
jgi:peptidoglycan hydrolase-like protein with peptidoglycan-binding domain